MKYRKFGNMGIEVSALGFGCMRFPMIKQGEKEVIDRNRAVAMIRHAVDCGLNYLDTAYPYHDGESERIVGEALKDGYRESVYLADKCPVWMLECEEDFDRILNEQLEKLGVEYIDFYLLHALDRQRMEIVRKFHLIEHMEKARTKGKIRHLGFSFHDDFDTLKEIIRYYEGWEFCQLQYNYVDVDHQAGIEGLRYAAEKGLGVVIMEPLRGGRLADVAPHLAEAFPGEKTPVEWALDFLWDQREVSLLLSGMGDEQQVKDNLRYAERSGIGMLSEKEKAIFPKAKEIFDTMALVKCTRCGYCMPCPAGIDIPGTFAVYNSSAAKGRSQAKDAYEKLETKAGACAKCRHCEEACPQHIGVSTVMGEISKVFEA